MSFKSTGISVELEGFQRKNRYLVEIRCLVSGNGSQSARVEDAPIQFSSAQKAIHIACSTHMKQRMNDVNSSLNGNYPLSASHPASNVICSVCPISILMRYFCNIKFSLHSRRFRVCAHFSFVVVGLFFVSLVEYVVEHFACEPYSQIMFSDKQQLTWLAKRLRVWGSVLRMPFAAQGKFQI